MSLLIFACNFFYCSQKRQSKSDKTPVSKADKSRELDKLHQVVKIKESSETVSGKKIVPLATPASYFGDIKKKHLTDKIKFTGKKNGSVILIVIDALNVKHMGAYGYKRETTPNIDALAKKGYMATNYISNSSWTRPSFTTIITGLTKKQHKVELDSKIVSSDINTIAKKFRKAGYLTAGFVGNPLVREIWGFGQGYHKYVDTHSLEKAFPPDGILANKANEWLETTNDKPFFLKIFFTAPHTPYRPIPGYQKFVSDKAGKIIEYPFREYIRPMDKDDHVKTVAAYDDEIRYVDMQIGKILKKLEELGRSDDTAIIITSDHGEVFGTHNCYLHTYHMWEPALRVPFIMYAPWLNVADVYDDRPYTHIDILPTALDMTGIKHDDDSLKGRSILADMADPSVNRTRVIFSQYNAHQIRRQAIRKENYKLIHHNKVNPLHLKMLNILHEGIPHADPKDLKSLATDKERWEFYNLADDPGETTDLFEKMKTSPEFFELLKSLRARTSNDTTDHKQLSPELKKALTAAGYFVSD